LEQKHDARSRVQRSRECFRVSHGLTAQSGSKHADIDVL
jgi:hypothetical protein